MKNLTEFIGEECDRIQKVQSLVGESISLFQGVRPFDSIDIDWEYTKKLIERAFESEISYLKMQPFDYFELYISENEKLFDDRSIDPDLNDSILPN